MNECRGTYFHMNRVLHSVIMFFGPSEIHESQQLFVMDHEINTNLYMILSFNAGSTNLYM